MDENGRKCLTINFKKSITLGVRINEPHRRTRQLGIRGEGHDRRHDAHHNELRGQLRKSLSCRAGRQTTPLDFPLFLFPLNVLSFLLSPLRLLHILYSSEEGDA